MNIFTKGFNQIKSTFSPTVAPENWGGSMFYPVTGESSIEWGEGKHLLDFLEVPEVNAVISWKIRAFSNMKISIISKTTGKEVTNQEKIVQVLRSPNYFQAQKEFLQQTKAFQEIFGNEFIYFLTPVGMPNSVKGMFTIPPQMVQVRLIDKAPYFQQTSFNELNKITYTWQGKEVAFDPKSIIHINKAKANVTDTDWVLGESPMTALQAPIRNIRAAYEARNVLIENRGALGILSNAGTDGTGSMMPMQEEEKEELQKSFSRYGMTKKQWQVIITNLSLKWQQMAIDADKLKLFEETREDFVKICDGYGVNYELFGSQKGVTFANKLQAEKNTYQDTIIPEANEWIDALNRRFETANKTWFIQGSFDHLPLLQEDLKDRATTINTLVKALNEAVSGGLMTLEQAQAELKRLGVE